MENVEKGENGEIADIEPSIGGLPTISMPVLLEPRSPAKYRKLFEKVIGDKNLLRVHAGLMGAASLEVMQFDPEMTEEDIQQIIEETGCLLRKLVRGKRITWAYYWAPDNKARKEALDMAYKLNGYYAPEQIEDVSKNPYSELSTEELVRRRNEAIAFYKKR